MTLVLVLGTLGAGAGLATGLAFNLRLIRALESRLGTALVNFATGGLLLLGLWALGVDGARAHAMPPLWMLTGGLLGATYAMLSLTGAARLGPVASTVTVTLGQVVGALLVAGFGWLGQTPQRPSPGGLLSAALLLAAVTLVARDRAAAHAPPRPDAQERPPHARPAAAPGAPVRAG